MRINLRSDYAGLINSIFMVMNECVQLSIREVGLPKLQWLVLSLPAAPAPAPARGGPAHRWSVSRLEERG